MSDLANVTGTPGEPPRLPDRLCYGVGDLAFVALWQACALFLLFFYTDILGLPALVAGGIYLASMAWDAVSDPLVASWSERRARTGRGYGDQILGGAVPTGLAFVLVYTNPFAGVIGMTVWALVTHLLFRTAFTFASMPYNALPARLTDDADARSALSTVRVMFAAVGGIITAVAFPALVGAASESAPRLGHVLAAGALGAVAVAALIVCGRRMRRAPPLREEEGESGTGLAGMWAALRAHRTLQSLMVLMAVATLGYGMFSQSLIYFATHVLERPELTPVILAAPILVMILTAPGWMMLAARTSKRVTLLAGIAVSALGYAGLGLAPTGAIGPALMAIAISGLGSAAMPVMFWSMLPDVIDDGHARSGTRVETRTFGLATFVQKAATGVTALAVGGLLTLSQYDPQAVSAEAQTVIRSLSSWLPAALSLVMLAVVWGYPLDRARHRAALEQIAATRSGG